ncbi:hypothetical protein A4D02_03795 [Niastella koreensis]|uniref:2TM domain-containing protein n=2 Tax=Niastella koreensis TaxID=354356 RepID=G8TP14_NIAKG|nr:2TM domain-containing protein [Niastella koreensis]AEW03132.1 hypothetical protein Niako_6910 [Niastella koreensis GR20-10]OQP55442.1 hypothetical protein A4D02_03795 [Niastella koreensis]
MENEKDPQLWKIAKRRVGFKYNLIAYLGMNCFFWGIWLFTGSNNGYGGFPWPIWPMFGWGIGVLYQFFDAYVFTKNGSSVEREYEKLKRQQGNFQ